MVNVLLLVQIFFYKFSQVQKQANYHRIFFYFVVGNVVIGSKKLTSNSYHTTIQKIGVVFHKHEKLAPKNLKLLCL